MASTDASDAVLLRALLDACVNGHEERGEAQDGTGETCRPKDLTYECVPVAWAAWDPGPTTTGERLSSVNPPECNDRDELPVFDSADHIGSQYPVQRRVDIANAFPYSDQHAYCVKIASSLTTLNAELIDKRSLHTYLKAALETADFPPKLMLHELSAQLGKRSGIIRHSASGWELEVLDEDGDRWSHTESRPYWVRRTTDGGEIATCVQVVTEKTADGLRCRASAGDETQEEDWTTPNGLQKSLQEIMPPSSKAPVLTRNRISTVQRRMDAGSTAYELGLSAWTMKGHVDGKQAYYIQGTTKWHIEE